MQRTQLIDTLRGLAMLVMILTHTTVFFLQDPTANFLWNWSHFAVPIFVFCSVYLFFKKSLHEKIVFWSFIKKRFIRLLIPYYWFLVFFLIVLFFTKPETLSIKYILQSIFVIGGVDINWLVLLFMMITIILPFFAWSFNKAKTLFWGFFGLSLISTAILLFVSPDISYKAIMWLPWSTVLFVTLFYVLHQKAKKALYLLFLVSGVTCLITACIQLQQHHSLVLINNKYPPNLFYLSYGITILLGLTLLPEKLFAHALFLKTVNFFSKFSYSIYFIHYLILTIMATVITQWHFTWYTFFLMILMTTIGAQLLMNIFQKEVLKKLFANKTN